MVGDTGQVEWSGGGAGPAWQTSRSVQALSRHTCPSPPHLLQHQEAGFLKLHLRDCCSLCPPKQGLERSGLEPRLSFVQANKA